MSNRNQRKVIAYETPEVEKTPDTFVADRQDINPSFLSGLSMGTLLRLYSKDGIDDAKVLVQRLCEVGDSSNGLIHDLSDLAVQLDEERSRADSVDEQNRLERLANLSYAVFNVVVAEATVLKPAMDPIKLYPRISLATGSSVDDPVKSGLVDAFVGIASPNIGK